MTAEKPSSGRELPGFFVRWRVGFGDAGNDLRPVDYLNDEDGLRRTIAARWLFRPNFVEHRGCVIVVTDGTDAEQLREREIEIVDQWYDEFHGDITKTEAIANLRNVDGYFASVADTGPYDEFINGLAYDLAACWEGLLKMRFPDREFVVEVYDDEAVNGTELTFYTKPAP